MHSHQKCASLPLKSFSSLELSFVTHPPSTVLAHHFGSQDLPPSCLFLSLPPRLCSGVNFTSICPLQQFPHTSTLGCQSYAMSLLPRQGNQSEVAILFPSGWACDSYWTNQRPRRELLCENCPMGSGWSILAAAYLWGHHSQCVLQNISLRGNLRVSPRGKKLWEGRTYQNVKV